MRSDYWGFRPDAPKNRKRATVEFRDGRLRPTTYERFVEALRARREAWEHARS
jgi:hypothetical protein